MSTSKKGNHHMLKTALQRVSLLTAIVLLGLTLYPAVTSAQSARAQEARQQVDERRQNTEQSQSHGIIESSKRQSERAQGSRDAEERRGQAGARLDEARLKVCERREDAILSIMARIADRGTKQLNVFTKIADRVQEFYAEQGNPLNNYDALVENIQLKKSAAEDAVMLVMSEDDDFSCSSDNPKEVVGHFKESKRAMNTALKEYKTAVNDLIVGVKSAQNVTSEGGV